MEFLIIGAGSVGKNLAEKISLKNNFVTIVDQSIAALETISVDVDLKKVHGNGYDTEILENSGIRTADFVIAVTDNDAVNVTTALFAKLINPKAKRIVRTRSIDFNHPALDSKEVAEQFDLVIDPPKLTATYIEQLLKIPHAKDIVYLADNKLLEFAVVVKENAAIAGKKISTLSEVRKKIPCILNAIVRDETVIVPRGSDRILAGDLVYLVTYPKNVGRLLKACGHEKSEFKNILVAGGNSNLAQQLCLQLENSHFQTKLIMNESARLDECLTELQNTLVISGRGSDERLLLQENISAVDAFVAVDKSEEQNILASLLAKKLGAEFVVTKINDLTDKALLHSIGIDTTVNSEHIAATAIIKFVYANTVLSATNLVQAAASTIEYKITEASSLRNINIADLDLPYGILISAIIRGDKVIIPHGNDQLQTGDQIILFFIKSVVKKVEKMLGIDLQLL